LHKFRAFEQFTDTELARLAQVTKMRAYNTDERLFKEGSDNLELFMILKGCVRIVKYNESEEEVLLGNVCSNGIIGETFLVQKKTKYNSTGLASEFVETLTISKDDLEHLMENEPDLGNKLLMMFIDALYFKLNRTNIAFKEQLQQDSNLSEMN
jgi:CRP-like cAMP-binding protein